ncbi:glycerophosphodiester phosphodiesterase [Actinocorallia sp. API 0066]|uniref:glycerophosphodiester phosphodiesterase n=1 Tax=Actinocorallia sp. API 0066 TaxID=2896846 RepID=UPI001E2D2B06|nr:glycerophosphodiester phosphodiesterase [Actinocorallia sp. API 0066]MCD0448913.1 glycerophosphodiester phosphodiesterase [Actinocorallia sp. API 0066]
MLGTRTLVAGVGAGVVAASVALVAAGQTAAAAPGKVRAEPIVVAHRGASAYRPEHTLAAYELAIRQGADYIEPDLVPTKDGVLVARHENALGGTTDVADRPEFAALRKTKTIDGFTTTDWFTEDFTFAQLRTLRAKERIPATRPANQAFDGQERIPTFDEVVRLAKKHGVGVYPETKHPTYFASIGLPFEKPLLKTLKDHGLTKRNSKVFIQSFEPGILQRLDRQTDVRLVLLLNGSGQPYDFTVSGDKRTYADLATRDGLRWTARFADGIGPATSWIIPLDAQGRTRPATTLVKDAHRAGLTVVPWTFRPENSFLPADFRAGNPDSPVFARAQGDAAGWLRLLLAQGIDGIFADDPALATAIVD